MGDIQSIVYRKCEEIIVQSSDGVFLFDDVTLKRYKTMPPIQDGKLITSHNICIFNDGLRFAAAFWETQLILSSFEKFKSDGSFKDLTKKCKQKILEIKKNS